MKMNNYEKIKQMSIEEMAKFIDELTNSGEYTCGYCIYDYIDEELEECHSDKLGGCTDKIRTTGIKQWLESEVEDEKTR